MRSIPPSPSACATILGRPSPGAGPTRTPCASLCACSSGWRPGAPSGQRVKTADLLIAALAAQNGVGVLHYDADYDVIGERAGEPFDSEWLCERGTLESATQAAVTSRKAYRKAFGERMVQLQDDTDLEVWPKLIAWLDQQLTVRGLGLPPPPLV